MNLSSVPVDELDQYGSAGARERQRRRERERERQERAEAKERERESRQWYRAACNECLDLLADDSKLGSYGNDRAKTSGKLRECCGTPPWASEGETVDEQKEKGTQELARRRRQVSQQVKAQQTDGVVPGVTDRQLAMVAGGVVGLWVLSRSMGSSSSSSSGGSSRRSFGKTTELSPDGDGNVECPECGAEKSARGVFGHMRFSEDHPDPEEIGLEIDDG